VRSDSLPVKKKLLAIGAGITKSFVRRRLLASKSSSHCLQRVF
jgi:hypothetical protein